MFRIYAQHPEPHAATVNTDGATMQPYGIYLYTENNQTFAEVVFRYDTTTVLLLRSD